MGHVHLSVADVPASEAFYRGVLGFAEMARLGDQATFLGAGGYHHHLGANVWNSRGAAVAGPGTARLQRFTVELPDVASRDAAADRVADAGGSPVATDRGVTVVDPSGIELVLAA
jgi:catechol 2,3-dioxygenase